MGILNIWLLFFCFVVEYQTINADISASDRRYDERKDRRMDHRRRNERGDVGRRDVAHMPAPQDSQQNDHNEEVILLRSARDLAQQLNMTLMPPENKMLAPLPRGSGSLLRSDMVNGGDLDSDEMGSWADESADFAKQVVSKLVPGLTGDVPGSLIRRMSQGVEKRKIRTLQQQGIQYDPKTALYRNPLGLPCDPRTHPLLCTLDEDFTSSTSTKSLLQQHRQAKKEQERQQMRAAASLGFEASKIEYNPFEDGPLLDERTLYLTETTTMPPPQQPIGSIHTDDFVGEVVARRRRKLK